MDTPGIGYLIKNINDLIKIRADEQLGRHDLTFAQCHVLGILHYKGGTATQKEIGDELGVWHPTVVGLVSRVESAGYVMCRPDPTDRRNKLVSLTPKAEVIGSEIDEMIRSQEEKMTRGLSPEQVDALIGTLSVIYKNLDR